MRIIKFKAKRLDDGRWKEGCYCFNLNGGASIFPIEREVSIGEGCMVDPSTVCQFTGFLDKNGKEIYEGDVLRSDEYPFSCIRDNELDNYYGIIGWSEEEASFYIMGKNNPKSSVRGISDGICDTITQKAMYDFEIVGNIYDPEWQQKLELNND